MPNPPTRDREKYSRAARDQRGEHAGRQAWQEGRVQPFVITQGLNVRQLDGPLVDELCGTSEPAVDMWEAGQLYPTWDELKALADATDFPVAYFTTAERTPIAFEDTTLRFHLKRGQKPAGAPVLCFEPVAIEAATGTTRCPYCGLSSRPVVSMHEYRTHRSRRNP
jgi:transcriptional regulator with XRE-family HTH domain